VNAVGVAPALPGQTSARRRDRLSGATQELKASADVGPVLVADYVDMRRDDNRLATTDPTTRLLSRRSLVRVQPGALSRPGARVLSERRESKGRARQPSRVGHDHRR